MSEVRVLVGELRGVGSKNPHRSSFIIDLAAARKARQRRELVLPRVCQALALADQYQRELDTGVINRRSDLALLHGIYKPRVTQLLDLHRLHPEIIAFIRSLKPGKILKPTTEKKLRAWVELSPSEQLKTAEVQVAGFAEYRKAQAPAGSRTRFGAAS